MQISIHYNKFVDRLEHSVNQELKELQQSNNTIIDIKVNATENGYIVTIIYE